MDLQTECGKDRVSTLRRRSDQASDILGQGSSNQASRRSMIGINKASLKPSPTDRRGNSPPNT